MLKPQSTMKRSLARSVRWRFVSLAIVGLAGCEQLGPTSGATPREEVADTRLALPAAAGEWTLFDTDARSDYSGVELGDGSVLVCGGVNQSHVLSCNRLSFDGELHSQAFPLPEARLYGTLSLVSPNRILLAGGTDANEVALGARLSLPFPWTNQQNIWGAPEGSSVLPSPRADHTATRLDSSLVLIGGRADIQQIPSFDVRSDQGVWTKVVPATALATRAQHSATLLKSQPGAPARVLILGGYSQAQGGYLSSGFIFSLPNTITPIADMPEARQAHTATLLDDGSVLVAGGMGLNNALLATTWRYYPDTNQWASARTIVPRKYHAAARLGADVIIAGGQSTVGGNLATLRGEDDSSPNRNTVQRYNAATNEWSSGPNLRHGRSFFEIFALDGTHLLAVGGATELATLSSSEVFSANVLGQPSGQGYSCLSGHVADGVCCDTDCLGACNYCNAPNTPGVCQKVSGPAPVAQRACGESHLQCSAGLCPDNCDATHPCESRFFCGVDAACHDLKKLGTMCTTSQECAGGAPCVDGVCCESACSGSCEACNQPDRSGLCRPLPSGDLPHAGHPGCAAAHDADCGGACDGHTTDRCIFAELRTSCGADATCTSGEFHPAGECDGRGTCEMTPVQKCGKYACDSQGGCLDQCAAPSDCAEGYNCNDGDCMHCVEDECGALGYQCDRKSGECPNTCARSAECAGGYYCHPLDHRCVLAVPFPAASLPACSIGHEPVRSRAWLVALASVLGVVSARRARRVNRRRAR